MKNKKGFTIIQFFAIIIVLVIVLVIFINIFTNGYTKEGYSRNKDFKILMSPDNKVVSSDLEKFAKQEKINLTIKYMDDLESVDKLKMENELDEDKKYDAVWMSNSVWLYMLNNVSTTNSKAININPVVFGIKKSKAQELGFVDKKVSNQDIVDAIKNKKLNYVMSSVTKTNTGLISYLGFLSALSGSPEILTEEMVKNENTIKELATLFSGVERVSGSTTFLEDMFLKSNEYDAVLATESSLISINKRLEDENKETLYLIYPFDGVAINDSPFAYVDNGQKKEDKFLKLQNYLLSNEMQKKLESYGMRTWYGGINANADSSSFKSSWGINTNEYLIPLKYPSKDVITRAIGTYIDYIRKPSSTVFCLDVSGSMSGDGLQKLQEAMNYILDYNQAMEEQIQFSSRDRIAILPFSNSVNEIMETQDGKNTQELINKINNLNAGGGTDLYGCAIEALKYLNKVSNDYTKTVILMTDGRSTNDKYSELSSNYYNLTYKIPIYSIMFGDADRDELDSISDLTNAKTFDGKGNALINAFKEVRSYN